MADLCFCICAQPVLSLSRGRETLFNLCGGGIGLMKTITLEFPDEVLLSLKEDADGSPAK